MGKNNRLSVNNALLIVVSLLIVMSAIQIFQFQKITRAISSGAVNVSTQSPSNGTNLPSQVGGCG